MRHIRTKKTTEPQTPRKRKFPIFMAILVVSMLLLSGIQISLAARVATMGRTITSLERQRDEKMLKVERLHSQIHEMSTLTHVETQAREAFGMVGAHNQVEYLSLQSINYLASRLGME